MQEETESMAPRGRRRGHVHVLRQIKRMEGNIRFGC